MTDDERFMLAALDEAQRAGAAGEVPVGAVVVKDGRIIGRGHNRCEALQDATAHAEMIAITAAGNQLESWRLEDCTLYVSLEPCPMCMGASLNSRISRIVYGAREPKAGACGSVVDLAAPQGFNHAMTVEGGLLADQSSELLKGFFRQLRAKRAAQRGSEPN
ncbi:MAG: tRNA adenosine(34) deaminase TadA [Planctomycetota bacterium]|jgi:tRNA(adenine34) deaminase|nr:tRNA adenosine(34) deaminase TadA [Planctomycetota bacterium]